MRIIIFALVAACCIFARPSVSAEFVGRVTTGGGDPVEGVFVTARDVAKGMATSVMTRGDGTYRITELGAGSYDVSAYQIGFNRTTHTGQTLGAKETQLDFVLGKTDDLVSQVRSSTIIDVFPDDTPRRKLILDCMGCHQFNQKIVYNKDGNLRSEAEWIVSTEKMISFCGPKTMFPIMPPDRLAAETGKWVAAYLTQENVAKAIKATKTVANRNVTITEYDLPGQKDFPHDLMIDKEGKILVTGMFSASMYMLDPATGVFDTRTIPTGFANPRALDVAPNGDWCVALGMPRKVAHYSLASDEWKFFDIGAYPHSVVLDPSGRLWFNGHFSKNPELIGYVSIANGDIKKFEVPSAGMSDEEGGPIPYGLRVGPDGVVWGTELAGNRLVKFDPSTERFSTFNMPQPHSGPRRLDVGPDGIVWVPQYAANKLARFDPKTEKLTEYEFPTSNSLPYCARVDRKSGVVWITQTGSDAVTRFDPKTETFIEYPLPSQVAFMRHIDIDSETGTVWGAYSHSPGVHPRIVRLKTDGSAD